MSDENKKIERSSFLSYILYGVKSFHENKLKPFGKSLKSAVVSDWKESELGSMISDDVSNVSTSVSAKFNIIWPNISAAWSEVWTKDATIKENLTNLRLLDDAILTTAEGAVDLGASTATSILTSESVESVLSSIDRLMSSAGNKLGNSVLNSANTVSESLRSALTSWGDQIGSNAVTSLATSGMSIFADSLSTYIDGIEETTFGSRMESSWKGNKNSFLNTFKNSSADNYTIKILSSTPLDAGSESENLYGSMILGCPPLFNNISDPNHRVMANTFLKDAKILSLTPGLPKYNGSSYLSGSNNSYNQTKSGKEMIEYLLKNGIDTSFQEKDKRYYTFETDYENYFAYLETMLNTIWIKLGLASEDKSTFNLYSFFNIKTDEGIDPGQYNTLKRQYRNSLGFYINTNGILAESIDSTPTSFGQTLKQTSDQNTDSFQLMNYLSGMGTGGAVRNATRTVNMGLTMARNLAGAMTDIFSGAISGFQSGDGAVGKIIGLAAGAVSDISRFTTEEDLGAYMQSFATTNGMRTFYPELWSDSSYSRSININFNFVSPYGDPMSIFQNVFVPFCALACFAFPRQAADNGLVSPFMIRADVPGIFTTDLGMITNFTFTRGGDNHLWTKDGLPRAISGTFSITDLYQYLSMTKRLSFMSANPSYTVFLDSLCGLHAVYHKDNNDDALNDYFKQMLNRVSGLDNTTNPSGLWNSYDKYRMNAHKNVANISRQNSFKNKTKNIYWMRSGK